MHFLYSYILYIYKIYKSRTCIAVNRINFSQNRFQPSVHNMRAGLNNRYQMNAYNAAMMRSGSVFMAQPAVQSFSYTETTPTSYVAGNVIGKLTNIVGQNWSGISNFMTNAFNTVKGWFS